MVVARYVTDWGITTCKTFIVKICTLIYLRWIVHGFNLAAVDKFDCIDVATFYLCDNFGSLGLVKEAKISRRHISAPDQRPTVNLPKRERVESSRLAGHGVLDRGQLVDVQQQTGQVADQKDLQQQDYYNYVHLIKAKY